jgi:hypothetical protein
MVAECRPTSGNAFNPRPYTSERPTKTCIKIEDISKKGNPAGKLGDPLEKIGNTSGKQNAL